jgi:hypothetical protein
MGLFDINYGRLTWQILPLRLRKTVHYAWLNCLVTPVVWLYGLFSANRTGNLYRLAHNSQVVYLEAALNDTFDLVSRRIYIADGPFKDPLFTYLVPEDKPVWLGLISEAGSTIYPDPEVLYTDSETALLGLAFIVMVPVTISFNMARLRALVDLYRLAGKSNYSVETF